MDTESKKFIEQKIKVQIIGDSEVYSPEIQNKISILQEDTKHFEDLTLSIALNYGGREEIIAAANMALQSGETFLTKENFEKYLQTGHLPQVDLLIRTGGLQRISNFMLWKITYAEFYFTNILWPEFGEEEFKKALEFWKAQKRNFGK